jgi:hypothetical protein
MSWLARIYVVVGLAMLGFFGVAMWSGWEWGNPKREHLPADVRSRPGGWRSFVYVGGYRGGK